MALSQGAKYSDYTIDQFGHAIGGVQVRVCATISPATPPPTAPCTPLASLFTDQTLTFPAANPLISDSVGNFSFYATTGFYILQFYQNGTQTFAQTVQVSGTGAGGGGSGTVTSVSSTSTLLTIANPTTTPSITPILLGAGTQLVTTSAAAPGAAKCAEFAADGTLGIAGSNVACGAGGGGITTLNPGALTGPTVTLATDAAGTDFGVAGAANAVTFSLPTASAANRGALSSADWSTFNSKQAAISATSPITLAGASIGIVNQGAVTTVLHGNASGNASFAAVTSADTTGTFAATAHNLLSATHGDTTAHAVLRGDLIAGIGASPSWTAVAKGGINTYPKWNASGDVIPSTNPASGTGSPTTCTNQFVTTFVLNADSTPTSTCTTDTLASAQHANQGTTTTVLHGNATGNPSWSAVTSADTTGTFPATAHNLLSTTHGDTTAASVSVGDIITGQTGPLWKRLAANTTATKQYLQSVSSSAPSWQQIAYADVSGTPTLRYQTVQDEGSNLAQEPALNLTGTGVTCVDNAGVSTDCAITSGGGSSTAGATLFATTTLAGPNNTVTETSLLSGTGISGTKTIPANTFGNGTVMHVELGGFYSTPAITVDNLTLRVKCGSTVLASKVISGLVVSAANQAARLLFDVHAIGTGASGSLLINTIAEFTGTTLTASEASIVNTTAVAFDFTTSCAFDVTAQWGAAQSGESISAVGAAWIPGAPVFSVNGQVGATSVGTVTSIATTAPITGGTINTTGTIACPTCVTSAASLASNALMLGAGGQASATLGSLGTTTTLLHGNVAGAPSFGAVVENDVTNGYMDLSSSQTISGSKIYTGDQLAKDGRPVYDVMAYGAVNNGVTDDGPAINAAITAACANNGGRIYFPPGLGGTPARYFVNTQISVACDGLVFEGAAGRPVDNGPPNPSSYVVATSLNAPVFKGVGTRFGIMFRNFGILGSASNTSEMGIQMPDNSGMVVRDMFIGFMGGPCFQVVTGSNFLVLDNNFFTSCINGNSTVDTGAIDINQPDVTLHNTYVDCGIGGTGALGTGHTYGVLLKSSAGTSRLDGVLEERCQHGIRINSSRNQVRGGRAFHNQGNGMIIDPASSNNDIAQFISLGNSQTANGNSSGFSVLGPLNSFTDNVCDSAGGDVNFQLNCFDDPTNFGQPDSVANYYNGNRTFGNTLTGTLYNTPNYPRIMHPPQFGARDDSGDNNITLSCSTDMGSQNFNTPLSTNHIVTLSTPSAWQGCKFLVTRTINATGPYGISFSVCATCVSMNFPGMYEEVEFKSGQWWVTKYGWLAIEPTMATTTATIAAMTVPTQLAPPVTTPVLACSNSGGSLAAATHFFKIAFNNTTAGETTPGPEASCATTGATGSVVVTSPTLPTNATGYTVYDSNTTNTELRQAASGACVNISANCTVTVLGAGPALPTTNTSSACPTTHTVVAGETYCLSSDGTVASSEEIHAPAPGTQAAVDIYNAAGTFFTGLTSAPTANRTATFPDNTGIVAELNLAQSWTADQTMNTTNTGLKIPVLASASPTVSGNIAYDSTSNIYKGGINGTGDTFDMLGQAQTYTATKTYNQPANKLGQASIIAASAAINTTETVIVKTLALPANRLLAGTVLRIVLVGTCTSTVANASTIQLRYGTNGTTADGLLSTGTVTAAASGTTIPFKIIIDLTVRTTGASGTGFATYEIDNNGVTGIAAVNTTLVNPTMSAFNTTTANAIISATYKSAATTTTSTFQQAWIEVVYQ